GKKSSKSRDSRTLTKIRTKIQPGKRSSAGHRQVKPFLFRIHDSQPLPIAGPFLKLWMPERKPLRFHKSIHCLTGPHGVLSGAMAELCSPSRSLAAGESRQEPVAFEQSLKGRELGT